ncbi:MAG: hypothetical protein LC808_06645 [Actinobacteria bacterium]|nr:hypothetical protein [Actinomycetota bacterium]
MVGNVQHRSKVPVPSLPVVVRVLVAVVALGVLIIGMIIAPGRSTSRSALPVIGEQETVRITGPTGKTIEGIARVDTGASASSIDEDLARELGFDLENAEMVTVQSSLGREKRPVVVGVVQIAGQPFASRLNVTDRGERSNPVLLGRSDLTGFQVQVGQRLLTTPGEERTPSALGALLAEASALGPAELLALLPLAALVVVLLRVVVGIQTLGIFSPVLLAFGYTQAGLFAGLVLTALMIALGFASQPLLRRFRLPRVARLTVLIGLVTVVLLAVQEFAGPGATTSWGAALPVVVTAVILERLWETWDLDGWRDAGIEAGLTVAVAVLVTALLLAPTVRGLAETVPLPLAISCAIWAAIIGTYRGLRLTELARFGSTARARKAIEPAPQMSEVG